MDKLYDVAVVGATGLVGNKILSILDERGFAINRLFLFTDEGDEGKCIEFRGKEYKVIALSGENVIKNRVDIAFFCVKSDACKKFAPLFSALGTTVIDNSTAFRAEQHIPLIVPSVNPSATLASDGIIACPDPSAAITAGALAPLHKKYGLKRAVLSTYQAVSDAGAQGIADLFSGGSEFFSLPIKDNVIAQIGERLQNGYTDKEQGIIDEIKKILGDDNIALTCTAAAVPVFYGHCVCVNAELNYSVSISDVTRTLEEAGVKLIDCPTPLECENKPHIFAGRIRRDFSHPNTFNLWLVCDNILYAALSAVEIAELVL